MKKKINPELYKKKKWLLVFLTVSLGFVIIAVFFLNPQNNSTTNKSGTKNQILKDSTSNTQTITKNNPDVNVLAEGEGLELVKTHCTSCHSAKLIVQNRATREGWLNMIRWMQQTQNLWDLGENEEMILNYLTTHYAPEEKGRRENLKDIEWYELRE